MSAILKTYRAYCFDSRRSIVTADFIQAADDQDAITRARAKGFGTQCELWEGRRMVTALSANKPDEPMDLSIVIADAGTQPAG